jgi:hypothetical protein
MPTDLRRITFGVPELAEALFDYDRYAAQKLTHGTAIAIDVGDPGATAVTVDLLLPETAENNRISLDYDYVNQALIMYCLNHGIPVFDEASVFVKPMGDKIALFCRQG